METFDALQIDPDEHDKVLKQLDELKKECESLKTMKESADKASVNAKTLIVRLNKELSQQRALVDAEKKKTAAVSSQASTDAIQERDQLKVKIEKLEKEALEDKKALEGATQRVETFKKHLRNYQKQIGDLKQQVTQTTSELEASKAELETARAAPPPSVTAEAAPPKEPMSLEKPEAAATKVVPDTIKVVPKTTPTDAPKSEPVKKATELQPPAKTPPEVPSGGFKFGPGGSLKPPPSKIPRKALKDVSLQTSGDADSKQEAVAAQGLSTTIVKPTVTTAQGSPPLSKAPEASVATIAETKSKEFAMREKLLLLKKRKAELMKEEEERAQKRAFLAAEGPSGDEIAGDESAKKVEEAAGSQELVAPGSIEGVEAMPMESETVEETPTPASEPMAPETSVPEGEGTEPEVAKTVADESKEDTTSLEAVEATSIETEQDTTSLDAAEATPIKTEQESQAPDESKGKAEPAKADVPAKASLFGGPSTFGSVSAFGSGTPFGMTGFVKAAPSLAFGTSSTIAKTTSTKEGESPSAPAPAALGSAASTEKPTAFGSGGTFLDIKPPSSTAPKFTFGSSPNITLPTPAKGLPVASETTFGVFGHGGASPFGRGIAQSTQAQPLFGAPVKRPPPIDESDEGQESAAKHPRIEEEEGKEEEQDDVDDDEHGLEEGEEVDENEEAE